MKKNGNSVKNLRARAKVQARDAHGHFLPKAKPAITDLEVGSKVKVLSYGTVTGPTSHYYNNVGKVVNVDKGGYIQVWFPTTKPQDPNPGLFLRSELAVL